jgi:hypothetical protein
MKHQTGLEMGLGGWNIPISSNKEGGHGYQRDP